MYNVRWNSLLIVAYIQAAYNVRLFLLPFSCLYCLQCAYCLLSIYHIQVLYYIYNYYIIIPLSSVSVYDAFYRPVLGYRIVYRACVGEWVTCKMLTKFQETSWQLKVSCDYKGQLSSWKAAFLYLLFVR